MNILSNPKSAMWICRLVPAVTWALWLAALLSHGRTHDGLTVTEVLLLASLVIYIPLVYFMLPVYVFNGSSLSVTQKVAYFIFTGVTAGIGPVVWYYVSVDGVLRKMSKNMK